MAKLLEGKAVVTGINTRVQKLVSNMVDDTPARLVVVQVGDDPSSQSYLRGIRAACERVGVTVATATFAATSRQKEVADFLRCADADPKINGILVMRPLPLGYDAAALGELLSPGKDVDCFSPVNTGRTMVGVAGGFPPCTPQAVMETLKHYEIPLVGRRVAVIGRSLVVGRPLAMLFVAADATVTICHSRTLDLADICRGADLIVAAAGSPGLVTGDMVRPGAVVVDVGVNFVNGQLVGDVDFATVAPRAVAITPVPGGIGTVTSAVLAQHVIAARLQTGN